MVNFNIINKKNSLFDSNNLLKWWNFITTTTTTKYKVNLQFRALIFPQQFLTALFDRNWKTQAQAKCMKKKRSSTRRMRTSNKSMMRLSILSTPSPARTFHPRLIWCCVEVPASLSTLHTPPSTKNLEMQLRIPSSSFLSNNRLIYWQIEVICSPPSLLVATLLLDEISLRATNIPSSHLTTLEWSVVLAARESQTRAIIN